MNETKIVTIGSCGGRKHGNINDDILKLVSVLQLGHA